MNNIDIPPFFIGQEVVAMKTHSKCDFKVGDEFIVWACYKHKCCGLWVIEIDVLSSKINTLCVCGKLYRNTNQYAARNFRPKHNYGEFISMKEFAEKQLETIGAH